MKTIVLIMLSCCSTMFAQTNIISFTNANGVFITNATAIKMAENKLLYRIPEGGGIVRLDSLPTNIQAMFNYNPAKAAIADQHERQAKMVQQQAEIERQKYLASLRGPILTVKISDCNTWGVCHLSALTITTNMFSGQIASSVNNVTAYLLPVPQRVRNFCNYNAQLENEIAAIANEYVSVTVPQSVSPTLMFNQNSSAYSIVPIDSTRADAQEALSAAVGKEREKMRLLKTTLQERKSDGITVRAFNTGLAHDGIPIWQPVEQ